MSQTQELNVAIIGLGAIGRVLAINLTTGFRTVMVAARDYAAAQDLANELGNFAQPKEISAAVDQADIIVLAIWFDAVGEFLQQYATQLNGKIIVDPSNPIAPDLIGGFVKIVGQTESAGQINASLLPSGAKLAKAFGTLGAVSLAQASGQTPEQAVLFYATDDHAVQFAIEELIIDAGFEPLYAGGLDQSIRLEVFGDLHEFGALGKPVLLDEARERLLNPDLVS